MQTVGENKELAYYHLSGIEVLKEIRSTETFNIIGELNARGLAEHRAL